MRTLQIVAIGIRLFAMVLVLVSVRYAVTLHLYSGDGGEPLLHWANITLSVLLPLVIATGLWFFPLTVANKIVPTLQAEEQQPPLSANDAQAVGFALLGLWVLSTAVPDVCYWLLLKFALVRLEPPGEFTADQIAGVWTTVVEIALGIYLLFGSRGLAGMVRRFRGHDAAARHQPPAA